MQIVECALISLLCAQLCFYWAPKLEVLGSTWLEHRGWSSMTSTGTLQMTFRYVIS